LETAAAGSGRKTSMAATKMQAKSMSDLSQILHRNYYLTKKKAPFKNDPASLTVVDPRERDHQKGANTK
jgi:hypothetical protein